MSSLIEVLMYKYPTASPLTDYQVGDKGDGVQFISMWNLTDPKPTDTQIQQWISDSTLDKQVTMNNFIPQLDNYVNAQAKKRNYDNAISVATYINSSNTAWALEAKNFIAWRDQVWTQAINLEQQVLAGTATIPATFQDFISTLPVLNWGD